MNDKVWFITAFWEVDYTDNPVTSGLLKNCGNYFTKEADAIAFLQSIKKLKDE